MADPVFDEIVLPEQEEADPSLAVEPIQFDEIVLPHASGQFEEIIIPPKPKTETEAALVETPTVSDLMSGKFGQRVKIPAGTKIPTLGEVGVVPKEVVQGVIRYATPVGVAQVATEAVAPDSLAVKVGAGVIEGGSEVLSSFTTPENLSQLAIMPQSKIGQIILNLGFGAEAVRHLPEQIKAYGETDDPQEKAKIAAGIVTSLGLPGYGLAHGIMRKAPVRPANEPGAQPATTDRATPETVQGAEPAAAPEALRAASEAAAAREAEFQRMSSNLNELNKDQFLPDRAAPATETPRGEQDAIPIRSPETEIPRTAERGQDQPGISGEARRGEQAATPSEASSAEIRTDQTPVVTEEIMSPGPGAAATGEFPAPKVTAIKNAAVDQQRAERGELPLMEPARKSNPATWEEAMEAIERDPEHASKIVDGIRDGTKKEINDVDQMAILHEEIRLRNERAMEADRAADPYTTQEERAQASERFEQLSNRINEVELAGHDAGTMSGRALQIRKQMIRDDYTPAGIERRMAAKKGGPLTEEEVATAKVDSEKILKEETAFEERVEQVKIEHGKKEAEAALKDMEGGKPKKPATPKDDATEISGIVDGIKAAREEGATLGGGLLDNFVKRLAKKFVDGGMRGLDNVTAAIEKVLKPILPDINTRQIHDAFSDYGKSKPATTVPEKVHLSQIRGEAQKTSALQDIIEKQKAPAATGPQRVPQSDISRRLTKLINEAKKRFNIQPIDPARALKTALESRRTYYTNKLADLRFEIAKGERIIKEKSLSPTDPALEALKAEYGKVKREHTEIFGKRELTPEQRLKSAIAVAERAELEAIKRLENAQKGIFGKEKVSSKVPPSTQLDAIRARTEAIREQVKELHDLANPKKTPEERALQSYKTRLKTQEAELLEKNLRADAGDATVFQKKVRKPIDISRDAEAMRLKATVEKSKIELGKKAEAYRLANRTLGRKILDGIKLSYDASTNLLSSFDLSAPRQAAFGLAANATRIASNPMLIVRPFKRMAQVLFSDARARRFEQERLHRPNAINGIDRQAKIEYTALDETSFSKREENARSILDEWGQLPLRTGNAAKTAVTLAPKLISRGVHVSNRAFNVFLNTMRSNLLDHLLRVNFKDRAPTKVELEAIGNLVNVATGRGKMRPATTEVMGRILWSPKLLWSRIQTLAGQPFYRGSARTRLIVAKEYARVIVSGYALLKAIQLFSDKDERDSRSSDFGKLVFDDTRIDLWGGYQQVLVQEERQRTGQTKTAGGKILNLRDKAEETPFQLALSAPLSSGEDKASSDKRAYGQGHVSTAANFLRTKLRPQLGAFVNLVAGENVVGEKTTVVSVLKDLTVPLAWKDIVDQMVSLGMPRGTAVQVAQMFGAGVQTYKPKPPKEKKKGVEPSAMPDYY